MKLEPSFPCSIRSPLSVSAYDINGLVVLDDRGMFMNELSHELHTFLRSPTASKLEAARDLSIVFSVHSMNSGQHCSTAGPVILAHLYSLTAEGENRNGMAATLLHDYP
jgi:hypothetical protein